jgi:hypothetical protein
MPAGNTPHFCRSLNALAICAAEFVAAGRDYPIVFASLDEGLSFAPVVVLGLEAGRNLFVGADGEWDRQCYLPAFVRRYPFCISKLYVDGEARGERVVCVVKSYLDPSGVALFDAGGGATERWRQVEALLAGFENELDQTAQMSAALAKLGLLEPFSLQVLGDGAPPAPSAVRMQGMFRVSEKKLNELRPANHKALVSRGFMGRIYAHLHSLENFGRLHQRARGPATATS